MDYKCREGIIRGMGIRRLSGRQPFFTWSVCGAVEGGSKEVWGSFMSLLIRIQLQRFLLDFVDQTFLLENLLVTTEF